MDWNIFAEKVDVIVNAVNIVGVMGKGLALQFKQVYGQEYFDSYRADCQKAAGDISAFNSVYTSHDGKTIYNFATKKDWRDPSSLEIISIGLDKLVAWLGDRDVSIAIPQLGCGCGGLSWTIVKPLIVNKLNSVKANVCLDGVWLKGGKPMDGNIIGPFRGDYDFLSNMYSCQVTIEGMGTFTCAEAAFQACKCTNQEDMKKFFKIDGYQAKRLGRKINCRSDWDDVRVKMMHKVVQAKFAIPELAEKLIATGNAEIVELNYWHDDFWGAHQEDTKIIGQNHLGKILMAVRAELQKKKETKTMENNTIKITTNTAIRADDKTFAVARIPGFKIIQPLVWDEKEAAELGVTINRDYNGTYTRWTMVSLQGGYLAHLRKHVSVLKDIVANAPCTLVVKPFQAESLTTALSSLGAKVELDTKSQPQPQSTNATNGLRMIGCGRVKGNFKNKGVSDPAKGGRASAILLPHEGYNFDPKNDSCWEVQGFVAINNKIKLGFFIFVAADAKDAARNMIRSWIDREVGKDAKVYTDQKLCDKLGLYKNFGIYGCFRRVVTSESRHHLSMAFECEHLDGPQFVFAKETVDMNSIADIMALFQSQKTENAALKAEINEQKTRIDNLEKQLAQLQVLLMTGSNNGNINIGSVSNNGDDDSNSSDDDDNGGNNTATPFDFEEVSDATLEDEPQSEPEIEKEPENKPAQESDPMSEQEETAPEQPAAVPEPEQSEVATAVTEEEMDVIEEFLSFANDDVQEDGLFKATDEEKQKAKVAKQKKVQRALKAIEVLGSTTKSFKVLVKKAQLEKFYDIKVDNGEVFINQRMFIEDWKKISIENNNLVVTDC